MAETDLPPPDPHLDVSANDQPTTQQRPADQDAQNQNQAEIPPTPIIEAAPALTLAAAAEPPAQTSNNNGEIDPALLLEPVSATTLEQAMESIQSELQAQAQVHAGTDISPQAQPEAQNQDGQPQFTPYVPNTVNGGRAATSGGQNGKAGPSTKTGAYRSVGPELLTPSRLAAASNGAFVPTGEPPYSPPPDVNYPPDHIPNPYAYDMQPQPILENFPPNSLYRPKYLPADIDDRLDQRSVWMGVEKDSARAVYFLPPTCQCCKHPAVAQHCDRGWPNCARCLARGVTCIPGKAWGMMRPKGKRRNLKAEAAKNRAAAAQASTPLSTSALVEGPRYSAAEKGKARASESQLLPFTSSAQQLPVEAQHTAMDLDPASGTSHVTKKRRSSTAAENGAKRVRRKSGRDSLGPLQGDIPLSPADRAYFTRLEVNNHKRPLVDMNGPCPVWAKTRRALQASVEYMRDPKQTAGGRVEIGVGGIARGLILEGDIEAQGLYWGTGEHSGTIITAIGHARRQRRGSILSPRDPTPPSDSILEPLPRLSTPPLNILPTIASFDSSEVINPDPANRFWSPKKTEPTPLNFDEEPAVAALLKAQRYRTPIAVAVAQDYAAVPFKVPRPLIVLGWFWIVDAWLEPVMPDLELFTPTQRAPTGPPEKVIWKFRLEWCDDKEGLPWWSSALEPPRRPLPQRDFPAEKSTWNVSAPTINGSGTVRPLGHEDDKTPSLEHVHLCDNCNCVSERVYAYGKICLNERCSWFFGDSSDFRNRIGPMNNEILSVQPRPRILPDLLKLRLRPLEPTDQELNVSYEQRGSAFWRGWVCSKCGLAQERSKWSEWSCEACGHSMPCSGSNSYTDEDLRNPSRAVCTGPRQEDGYATFPFQITRHPSLFPDDIKVVQHLLDPTLFGDGAQIQHAMNHEGKGVPETARKILQALQGQGSSRVPFRRLLAPAHSPRPIDAFLSTFYTYACGPETTPPIAAFPSKRPVPLDQAPPQCDLILALINERAGRMFPGQKEFNSLLVVASPPGLPSSSVPRFAVDPNSCVALLLLGSDQVVRIRSDLTKQGELTAQHGDVIGVKASHEPIEVGLKPEGFAFFCIARRVEPSGGAVHVPVTARQSSADNAISAAENPTGGLTYVDPSVIMQLSSSPYPANGISAQEHLMQGSSSVFASTINPAAFSDAIVKSEPQKTKSRPRPSVPVIPPKPAKPAEPPLTDWYIGAIPMDKKQPMKILPSFRQPLVTTSVNGNQEANEGQDAKIAGEGQGEDGGAKAAEIVEKEFLTEYPGPPVLLEPAPLSPLPGYDDLEPEEPPLPPPTAPASTTASTSKKATPASKAKARASGVATPVQTPTPTKTSGGSSSRGKGAKRGAGGAQPRLSGVSTPAESVYGGEKDKEKEDGGTPSSRGSVRGSGSASRGRGRGRGRKSNVE
ncbi:hypothetical protein IAT40_007214 [Kwoniella sp. CBS 6097]